MELKKCPFCGEEPYFERIGTRRQSCIIRCDNCGCCLETNEVEDFCGSQWNMRVNDVVKINLKKEITLEDVFEKMEDEKIDQYFIMHAKDLVEKNPSLKDLFMLWYEEEEMNEKITILLDIKEIIDEKRWCRYNPIQKKENKSVKDE